MTLTEALIQSFIKIYPQIGKLANKIQNKHNFIANYPLNLRQTSNGHAIISEGRIKKGNDIVLISGEQCMFSAGLSGSNPSQEKQINEQIETLSTQYQSMNADFMERMKIYLQLLANTQKSKHTNMPLRDYAEYVINNDVTTNISKAEINSRFLFELYQSWETSNRISFGYLKKQLLKRTEEEDFLNACNKGKTIIRDAGDSPYKFSAPFLDKLHHSFSPNCEFDVVHFPHRRAPFVRIRTIKDIQPGQKATISYGKLNNYELLLRYGFTEKDNPMSIFMLPLNFENIVEIFNKNIQWKQKQFLNHNIKLKNYVKILPRGDISFQDMKMMRILINDNKNPSEKDIQSSHLDPLIYRFICDHAIGMRKNIKINNLKVTSNMFIRQLEEQQISILEAFISKNSK